MDLRALRYFVSVAEAAGYSTGDKPSACDPANLSRTLSKLAVVPRIGRRLPIAPARLPRIQSPVARSAMQRRAADHSSTLDLRRTDHRAPRQVAAATAPTALSGRR